jgi:hypothetical protein
LQVLDVVDDDNEDGWTKVRRNIDDIVEEGYVPTSYIKAVLDFDMNHGPDDQDHT